MRGARTGPAPLPTEPQSRSADVIVNESVADGIHRLELAVPEDWGPPSPGQFVGVTLEAPWRDAEPGQAGSGLLRRPYSVADFLAGIGRRRLVLVYAAVGAVSRAMARLAPGASLELIGPLGRGFPQEAPEPVLLLGGGRGIAPLLFAARRLGVAHRRHAVLYGARRGAELLAAEAFPSEAVRFSSEDGARGRAGTVCDLLDAWSGADPGSLFACGPPAMLATVAARAARRRLPCWVSVEAHFGCGTGLCGGCAIPALDPPGGFLWACRDGPVIEATAIDWDRWLAAGEGQRCAL